MASTVTSTIIVTGTIIAVGIMMGSAVTSVADPGAVNSMVATTSMEIASTVEALRFVAEAASTVAVGFMVEVIAKT